MMSTNRRNRLWHQARLLRGRSRTFLRAVHLNVRCMKPVRILSRHSYLLISIGTGVFGLFVLIGGLVRGGEVRSEGIGFVLGPLGLPTTLLAICLYWIPISWDPGDFIMPTFTGLLFLAQWQLVAWLVYRAWHRKHPPNQSSEPTLSSGTSPAGQEPRLP